MARYVVCTVSIDYLYNVVLSRTVLTYILAAVCLALSIIFLCVQQFSY